MISAFIQWASSYKENVFSEVEQWFSANQAEGREECWVDRQRVCRRNSERPAFPGTSMRYLQNSGQQSHVKISLIALRAVLIFPLKMPHLSKFVHSLSSPDSVLKDPDFLEFKLTPRA